MTWAAIGLGSNLGDRLTQMRFGARALVELGTAVSVSSLYETAPIGGPEQEAFFNAVMVIDTDIEPRRLLDELHRIEAEAGRVREVRWGPRRLDLDLILYGNLRAEDAGMVVPHPRFTERRFVLDPLVEAWPLARTPEGTRVDDLVSGVADQDVTRLGSWWPDDEPDQSGRDESARPRDIAPGGGADDTSMRSDTFTDRGGWWVVGQGAVGLVVLIAVVFAEGTLAAGPWLRWLGVGLMIAGLLQSGLGLLHLGVSLSPYPEPVRLGNLVHGGIYRYVRHPVYGGITLGMVGLALFRLSWAGLIAALGGGLFFWLKAGFEERRLLEKYPGYGDYRRRTRARMIPGVL